MTRWQRLRALTLNEIRTIGFLFGLGVIAFWVVIAVVFAVFRPDATPPAPNALLVPIVAALVMQQAFKRGDDDDSSQSEGQRPVPPIVDRDTRDAVEGSATGDNDRDAGDGVGDRQERRRRTRTGRTQLSGGSTA